MPDPNESRPYNPYRADVDRKPPEQVGIQLKDWYLRSAVNSDLVSQRPRKHDDEKKLRKKNSQGLFVHDVSIVSARYDDQEHKWMYTLNDWQNVRIPGETQETELK